MPQQALGQFPYRLGIRIWLLKMSILNFYDIVQIMCLIQLDVCHAMYSEGIGTDSDADDDDSPLVVGHNIYILAYKLADHKRELKEALDKAEKQTHKAVQYYARNTAQIEV